MYTVNLLVSVNPLLKSRKLCFVFHYYIIDFVLFLYNVLFHERLTYYFLLLQMLDILLQLQFNIQFLMTDAIRPV